MLFCSSSYFSAKKSLILQLPKKQAAWAATGTVVYKASQVVQKHFLMVQKSSKGAGLPHMMKNLFSAFSLQNKERDRGSKNEHDNKNMKEE